MKYQKTLHTGLRDGVKDAYRSVRSKFNAYFGATAVGTLLVLAPMLPSLAHAQCKDKGDVIDYLSNLTKMSIKELKSHMEKWKKERGDNKYYNGVTKFKDSFVADVSVIGNNLQLKNGKRLQIGATVYYANFNKENNVGSGNSNVYVKAWDGVKEAGTWAIKIDSLEAAYKQKTGKDLKQVHVVVSHDTDTDSGEFVQLFIIPASTLEKVKKGEIEAGMPVFEVLYTAKNNALYSGDGEKNIPTLITYLEKNPPGVLAKKE